MILPKLTVRDNLVHGGRVVHPGADTSARDGRGRSVGQASDEEREQGDDGLEGEHVADVGNVERRVTGGGLIYTSRAYAGGEISQLMSVSNCRAHPTGEVMIVCGNRMNREESTASQALAHSRTGH